MANYSGLFNFLDYRLSNNQLELSNPPDSESIGNKASKDEDDAWYNMPLNSLDDDDDDDKDKAHEPSPPLPSQPLSLTLGLGVYITPIKKEHSISARIRAIYMLNKKQLAA
jgi:hypothetical protein